MNIDKIYNAMKKAYKKHATYLWDGNCNFHISRRANLMIRDIESTLNCTFLEVNYRLSDILCKRMIEQSNMKCLNPSDCFCSCPACEITERDMKVIDTTDCWRIVSALSKLKKHEHRHDKIKTLSENFSKYV